ncbi:MAG: Tm-1-like ATP-binding domain-containing protein [Proteobacteria bacterium]|nr:Tm-1-like ATP-binding domain-containing protein [Pseudomonadota bacterium]
MSTQPTIAVLATLDSKAEAAHFLCERIREAGALPWLIDLSLKPHDEPGADVSAGEIVERAGSNWQAIGEMERLAAGETMIAAGAEMLLEEYASGALSAVIGMGGANGCTVFCAMMRSLPPLFPKVMVTPVAATAAVQWYVAESDIAMFPTISDIVMNRFVKSVIENASHAVTGMARVYEERKSRSVDAPPLVGVSTFGNLQKCVDRVTDRLEKEGFEVMHFHASGPGGKALENLAATKELSGVIDITTSEMIDLINDGVYKPGDNRLTSAGAAGLPQVIAPGAIDHTNWWVGECPVRFRGREFYQYNMEILLMRTNDEEMAALGEMFAERLNKATGPVTVMIPSQGFSQHVIRETSDIDGNPVGSWRKPETDHLFTEALKSKLTSGAVKEFDLHINDQAFADACVDEFMELMSK